MGQQILKGTGVKLDRSVSSLKLARQNQFIVIQFALNVQQILKGLEQIGYKLASP
jgi:hypothetical protein